VPLETPIRAVPRRLRILWLVLGALLLVSVVPLWLYHRTVLGLSEEKLEATERVQQTEITRSLAEGILQFQSNLRQQLITQRQVMALTGWIQNVEDPAYGPGLSRLLQDFVASNRNILYVSAVGRQAKGQSAGSFRADLDPFVDKALKRAFTTSFQELNWVSDAFALGSEERPAIVMAVPLLSDGQFSGMLAAVVSLDGITQRLKDASGHDRVVYVVNGSGQIVVYPRTREMVPGRDVSSTYRVVSQFKDRPKELRATESVQFIMDEKGHAVEMIGTYSTIPELGWAVIAQRSLEQARADAGVQELTAQALKFVLVVTFVSLLVGYRFAVGITQPIQGLAQSTRAISRGEFHERASVGGAQEINELAENFNKMAEDIEQYVERLKEAARENRELFIGSIRMLGAAIDEKDPYTRGHSGRVAKYSVIIGEALRLSPEELDKLRISALLHDVGKIGVDDRVLKKPGSLTEEEFGLMRQHPVKGANIMRPVAQLKEMLPGIELHHEHIDGKGYPYGLSGDEIPLMARIIAVADTLDAITTNRPYQSAMDLDYALEKIVQLAGSKFDPRVVEALQSAARAGRLRLSAALVEV
jgi:HD-GYP domain-containing protein (c-di-GMP phosphodiesterase class II)